MRIGFNPRVRAILPLAATCLLGVLVFVPTAHAAVIGNWLFNEGSGSIAQDSSGRGNHGTIFGGATYVATPGATGISLDGLDDFVDFGQPAELDFSNQAFTVEIWLSIDTDAQTSPEENNYGIFGKSDTAWLFGYEHGGSGGPSARHNVRVNTLNGTSFEEGPVNSARPSGSMQHILVTKSSVGPGLNTDPVQFYFDGVCQGVCNSEGRTNVLAEAVSVTAGLGFGNYLECVIDEITVHDIRMDSGQVRAEFDAGPDDATSANTPPGRLNNLVTELLNLDQAGIGTMTEFEFHNLRKGWIFVSTTVGNLAAGDGAQITLPGPPVDTLTDHQSGAPETLEAMRWLPAGDHTLTLQTQGSAALQNLVVRAIPELMMWRYVAGTQLPQQVPVWDWAALKQHILPSMNTITAVGQVVEEWRPQHQAFIDEWNADGRRWLTVSTVPAYEYGPGMTTQQAYNWWATTAGYTQSDWDGIVVDEFALDDFPDSQYTQMKEALWQLTANFPDKLFYGFIVHIMTSNEPGEFMQAIVDNPGAIVWEWYESEEPNELSAQGKLDSIFSVAMQQWLNFIPNAAAEICVCFGYYSTPPFSLNDNPAVDYKVWMDMQFYQIANAPRFDGLRGIMEYNTKFTDEEVFRWQAALYRHYGIEGNTDRLSDTYGFTYMVSHIANPDFDQGTTGWTVTPAAGGGIGTGTYTGLGRLQGRVRDSTRGDNYLYMTRSSQAPNRITQQITGLTTGALYSMKMFTEDRQDYLNGVSAKQTHAVQIDIANVDVIPGRIFQQEMQSHTGEEVDPPFSLSNQPWLNYYWRLFRANGTTATLTISDWASESDPGGPIGQELMFNFIEIQPYFAIGDEVEFLPPRIVDLNQERPAALCFTGEVGTVYGLRSADQEEGPYTDTGARVDGTGGLDCLFDPNHAFGVDTGKYYFVHTEP